MHDPRVGRFFALDPIKDKYPYNSPYAFSENRVIDGVELEGLEVFLIHGTMMYHSDKMFTDETVNQFKRIGGNTKVNKSFSWGSNTWDFGLANMANSRYIERVIATRLLVRHVVNVRKEMLKNGEITMDEPITLVGYSNGGHLSIRAADEIERQTGVKVQIITYATPAYNDGSVEDPRTHKSIKKHINLYSSGDQVDDIAGGNETYNNKFTINYKIPNSVIKHDKTVLNNPINNNKYFVGGLLTHFNMANPSYNKKLGAYLKNTVGSMKNLTNNSGNNKNTQLHKPKFENKKCEFR
jgi:hypothetical protein